MENQPAHINLGKILFAFAVVVIAVLACGRSIWMGDTSWWQAPQPGNREAADKDASPQFAFLPPTRAPGAPILTPTPDDPHPIPSPRVETERYVVQPNDTLGEIAQRFGVNLNQIMEANQLNDPNLLEVGLELVIPAPLPGSLGSDFKILPDSELVYGPASAFFNVSAFIQSKAGWLAQYQEQVEGNPTPLSGAQIVERVAQDFSVNPRILLAALEYQSNWLTNPNSDPARREYPLGVQEPRLKGLYQQLAWAANNLNQGYYLWRVNAVGTWLLGDGSVVPIAKTINAGTAGVQHMFAPLYGRAGWDQAVSENGLFATFTALFGYPFDLAIEPLLPPNLAQPALQLPFEVDKAWAFTGGPHAAWGDGSAWGALDFAPPAESVGCVPSDEWVVAVGDGLILRSADGAVLQDLDGDGFEQSGWVILYMHVESRDRISPGIFIKAGERIGHPSCEGGFSTGTHVHLARRFNGEWIPADQNLPFILDGWVSRGLGKEYDGILERNGQMVEAWTGRSPDNAIQR